MATLQRLGPAGWAALRGRWDNGADPA
jgi:hypothetical protein